MEKIYIRTPAIKIVPSPGEPMSSPKELEILFTYVLGERNRELLVAEGLDVIPEDRRIVALMALQDLGWVDRKGFGHHEDTYKVTAEGRRIVETRPDFRKLDIGMKEHLDALRASDSGDMDRRKAGLRRLIEIECDLGNWDSAALYCHELRLAAREGKDMEALALSHVLQGRIERAQNNWHEALESYLRACELYMEVGDRRGVCATNRSLGIVYGSLGDRSSAIRCLEASASLAKDIEDKDLETKAQANLAVMYDLEGKFEESEKASKDCLEYFIKVDDLSNAARTSNNLGILNMSRERFSEAADHFERAIGLSIKLNNREVLGASLVNSGYCHARAGHLGRAMECTQEAANIFREPNNRNMLALAYRNYGCIEAIRSDHGKAREWFERSIREAKSSRVEDTLAACCYEYGLVLVKSASDMKLAKKLLARCSEIYRNLGNVHMAKVSDAALAGA
jgi:tetratricopeptide (TPR) repeat protein